MTEAIIFSAILLAVFLIGMSVIDHYIDKNK